MGDGWVPVVSENLGWHWSIKHLNSGITIYKHSRQFWATTTGSTIPQHHASAKTAALAVRKVIRALRMSANVLALFLERAP